MLKKRPTALDRRRAVVRVFRVAKVGGKRPHSQRAMRALQLARQLALSALALEIDVDDATIAGLEAGRGGWSCSLSDVTVPPCKHEYTTKEGSA